MKQWKIILPLGLAAAGAAALLLMKKPAEGGDQPAVKKAAKETQPAAPKKLQQGTYSFISGFKDPVTVDMSISFDPEKFSYAVISEEFLNPSSDSHVAVLWGEDYHMQLEYAAYYRGDDFETLKKHAAEKYKGFAEVRCGDNEGIRYLDGDSYSYCLRIPGDEHSYLLVTVIRAAADPEDFAALPEDPAFQAMIASIRFALKR